ncbi:hypothetical protein VIGAN_04265400 [Vigna angularis var. angularis]|uniref:Uncharacterized protein n=1 Tax=Vigna angularis var. angularis TaxID=157739 RepID=A0A0S3RX25_PHAAN|nr:hypothetical protein VIGAN_04265400 [Vigna angularis var. angularis]
MCGLALPLAGLQERQRSSLTMGGVAGLQSDCRQGLSERRRKWWSAAALLAGEEKRRPRLGRSGDLRRIAELTTPATSSVQVVATRSNGGASNGVGAYLSRACERRKTKVRPPRTAATFPAQETAPTVTFGRPRRCATTLVWSHGAAVDDEEAPKAPLVLRGRRRKS